MYGVSNFSAVINAPQAAILAVGAITEKPVVRDGVVTTAHLLGVTLACDHRILYGAPAAEFLARIRALLEEPLAGALEVSASALRTSQQVFLAPVIAFQAPPREKSASTLKMPVWAIRAIVQLPSRRRQPVPEPIDQ